MDKNNFIQYYVEGDDEKKLLNVLKTDMQLIVPGKVQKLNIIQNRLKTTHLMQLKPNTIVVLVFDTDTPNNTILQENITFLKGFKTVKSIICITQILNLEDELIRSCDIREIKELLNSRFNSSYKADLIKIHNLKSKLIEHNFDFSIFWSKSPTSGYLGIKNEAYKIKK